MSNESIYVIGAGNQAKVALATIEACGIKCAGIYDDDESLRGGSLWNVPILGTISEMPDTADTMAIIAIGDNEIRRKIAESFKNVCWPVIIHPYTCVHSSVRLGAGSVVLPGAIIQADAVIGKHTIVHTASVINHDTTVGSFCQIAARACLGDGVSIDDGSLIGMGTVVIPRVHIFSGVTVGAGSTVIRNFGPGGVYAGAPARRILRPILDAEE